MVDVLRLVFIYGIFCVEFLFVWVLIGDVIQVDEILIFISLVRVDNVVCYLLYGCDYFVVVKESSLFINGYFL